MIRSAVLVCLILSIYTLEIQKPILIGSSSQLSSMSSFQPDSISKAIHQHPLVQVYSIKSAFKPNQLSKIVQRIFTTNNYPNLKALFAQDNQSFFSMYIDYSTLPIKTTHSLDLLSKDFQDKHAQVVNNNQFVENIDCYLSDLKQLDQQIANDTKLFQAQNKKYLIILSFTDSTAPANKQLGQTVQFNQQNNKDTKMYQIPNDMQNLFQMRFNKTPQNLMMRYSQLRSLSTVTVETKKEIGINGTILSAYLISIFLLVILLIGACCLFSLQTPANFTKSNFVVGREA